MRLAYLLTWAGDRSTGVFKKVADQVSTWTSLGHEVGIFVATTKHSSPSWASLAETARVETYGNEVESFFVQRPLMSAIRQWAPDITYVRTTVRQFFATSSLRDLKHVIEIQTDDLGEARALSTTRLLLAQGTRRRRLANASGMVFVTDELLKCSSYSSFATRRITIGNGINISEFEPLPPMSPGRDAHFVFMGTPDQPWHGIDDVVALAKARPSWQFDLVGPSEGSLATPVNVRCHGVLQPDQYRSILARADVGISSLALYRNGMSEASPLKSREYLALGLPVIGGYVDPDLDSMSACYLSLPNQPRAILENVAKVEEFVSYWRAQPGGRVARADIAHLDSRAKEAARLRFLEACLQ